MRAPELSVVLTLAQHRGHARQAIEGFAHRQTLAADRYELVVLYTACDEAVAAEVAPLLRPKDRLLLRAAASVYELYNIGVREARCPWVLLTESHVSPDPSCLEAVVRRLRASPTRVVSLSTLVADEGSGVASFEGRHFAEGFEVVAADGPLSWHRVGLRGVAMGREIFLSVGGFSAELGAYNETALAVALDQAGHPVDVAPDAAIRHYNDSTMGDLLSFARDYRRGEQVWRTRMPPAVAERYAGPLPAPSPSRADALALARTGLCTRATATAGASALADLVRPGLASRASAWVAFLGSRVRLAWPFGNVEDRYAGYLRARAAAGRLGAPAFAADGAAVAGGGLNVYLADANPAGLVGFHLPELHAGRRFRWAAPLALLRLALPGGRLAVEIDTGGLRSLPRGAVVLTIDGRRAVEVGEYRWLVDLPPGGVRPRRIVLASPRLESPGDRRRLGLPVVSVRVT